MKLKPYIGFNRIIGTSEGAILIFAHSHADAKKLGFGIAAGMFVDEWIEWAVNRMAMRPDIMEQRKQDTPHVIDSPRVCPNCELWGMEPVEEGNRCTGCMDEEQE